MLEAVALLLKRPTLHVEVTASVGYTVHAPCLLAQLLDAVGIGLEAGSGARAAFGSRLPLAADALDLAVAITFDVNAWAKDLGVDRRRYLAPDPGSRVPALGRLLRADAAAAMTQGLPEVMDRIAGNACTWARRIELLFRVVAPLRGIRGVPCDACHAIWVSEERDGDTFREPALAVTYLPVGERAQPYLWCRGCGVSHWLDELDAQPPEEIDMTGAVRQTVPAKQWTPLLDPYGDVEVYADRAAIVWVSDGQLRFTHADQVVCRRVDGYPQGWTAPFAAVWMLDSRLAKTG